MSVIQFEIQDNVGVLCVNRPEARNALNEAAQREFAAACVTAAEQDDLRVLIVTGTGQGFVAGGDLRELYARPSKETGVKLNRIMREALHQLTLLPCPVIGAVNGDAAGGGMEILTACDLRIAVPHANIRFVQVRMGLTSGWGGTARLVQLVGQSRAMDLMLNGQVLTAAEAQQIGFLHRLTSPNEDVLHAAQQWAAELKQLPRGSLAALKALIHHAPQESLSAAYERERNQFVSLYGEADNREAVTAFMEKRPPKFNQ